MKQANERAVSVYANKGDMFEESDIGRLRVQTSQQVNPAEAHSLSPTESAYEHDLKGAALTTAFDKSAYICNPNVEPC